MTGPADIVWLASYPKSGNTWIRAIVTGLATHPLLFRIDQLSPGKQPYLVTTATALGLDHRWLDRRELDVLRDGLVRRPATTGDGAATAGPVLRKTHECYRPGLPCAEPFPTGSTRAAVLVVRDPRDVAGSFAAHFGVDIDRAIEAMAGPGGDPTGSPATGRTAQPWGSWSSHLASWLDPSVPFPVHLVRYEDLRADTAGTLAPVFAAIGLTCTEEQLVAAVERAGFERLQDDERIGGFREVGRRAERFFRRGTTGGWRDELSERQVTAIEADHGEAMTRLGYPLTTDPATRAAVAEALASRRRRSTARITLAPETGLDVTVGPVPDELDGGVRLTPYLVTTRTATIARVGPDIRLLVTDGRHVTVDWTDGPTTDTDTDTDFNWVVQGWAVAIAAFQRGSLSLHASTVRIGDEVVAIAGHSGAGKSTTGMGLRRRGHELLVDDTTVIEFHDGVPHVVPFARNVHLLPDAAAALGVDFDTLVPLAGGRHKSAFLPEAPTSTPCRLDRIVILRRSGDVGAPRCHRLGPERVAAISEHVSRTGLAQVILGPERLFEQMVRLANRTQTDVIVRPAGTWTLDAVLDLVETGSDTGCRP